MRKVKTRRMQLDMGGVVSAKPAWSDASITLRNFTGTEFHEAIITIESPWQLHYLRRELNKIEAGWRERLDWFSNSGE